MIVGPTKALFMDEISNGLDSSTTFQIVACLQQLAHITEATVVVSLLQPAPETYNLFDDIILMAEGKIVYQGPRSEVLNFFEECGFKCPERRGEAEFLQEVTIALYLSTNLLSIWTLRAESCLNYIQVLSRKDQEKYWSCSDEQYSYVSVDQFSKKFKACHVGHRLEVELLTSYDKSECDKNALSFFVYSLPRWELFKACMARELLLMKRHSFTYIFKTIQVYGVSGRAFYIILICSTVQVNIKIKQLKPFCSLR